MGKIKDFWEEAEIISEGKIGGTIANFLLNILADFAMIFLFWREERRDSKEIRRRKKEKA